MLKKTPTFLAAHPNFGGLMSVTAARVLIIEDDSGVAQGLGRGLEQAGFNTAHCDTGERGLNRLLDEPFDLVLLDLMLPERNGFEVLQAARSRVSVQIMVLSARTDLEARLKCFEGGAIDFVPKPFFLKEIVARIKARLPAPATPSRCLDFADVTAYEFNVLAFLVERPGRAVTRAQIADSALSENGECEDRTVDSHISRIRKKLGPDAAKRICTVWGSGYRCENAA